MSDFAATVAVWIGGLVTPALAVVAVNTRYRVGRWPWQYGVGAADLLGAMTAEGREYLGTWSADARDGKLPHRIGAFLLSFGLLWRAGVHSFVAAASYPDRDDFELDHGLTWMPIEMDRTPLWTARILTLGIGVTLAVEVGWLQWGWPAWAEWLARGYLVAQVGVWLAEPLLILSDYVRK